MRDHLRDLKAAAIFRRIDEDLAKNPNIEDLVISHEEHEIILGNIKEHVDPKEIREAVDNVLRDTTDEDLATLDASIARLRSAVPVDLEHVSGMERLRKLILKERRR